MTNEDVDEKIKRKKFQRFWRKRLEHCICVIF